MEWKKPTAQKAFDNDWRWRTLAQRSSLLFACAAVLEEQKEVLADLLCLENGKLYADALAFDVAILVGIVSYFVSLVDKLSGEFYKQGAIYSSVIYGREHCIETLRSWARAKGLGSERIRHGEDSKIFLGGRTW